jgi:hypothetical protein
MIAINVETVTPGNLRHLDYAQKVLLDPTFTQ